MHWHHRPTKLFLVACLMLIYGLWSGCALQPAVDEYPYGDLGHFDVHSADSGHNGVVVGVPYGSAEPAAVELAQTIRDALGARLVIAYDFKNKRIPVDQPLILSSQVSWRPAKLLQSGSVYPEFRKLVQSEAGARIKFYIGVRAVEEANQSDRLEVATVGLSFEQLEAVKQSFVRIRDEVFRGTDVRKLKIALNTLDDMSWRTYGVKNHGVLMLADKGLVLRLPKRRSLPQDQSALHEVIAKWLVDTQRVVRDNPAHLPQIRVERYLYGRMDSLASRKNLRGKAIAAPHGSFDWYTAELVEEMSYRTGLPAVITRGFTPTECGGWRIDVNRPSERRYPNDTVERVTDRAREVYRQYSQTVLKAAGGALDLYVEMHQNGTQENIEVATLGISRDEAQRIKRAYVLIRDRVLLEEKNAPKVNLLIEPVDSVEIGAWAAKEHGVLGLAKASLHFELPAHRMFYREGTKRAYTTILIELVNRIAFPSQPRIPQRADWVPPNIAGQSRNH